ncbi:MAG TPA: diguanylate cyclase [Azoarcus taiwanensis]|nr:diguanylate cyclase [Azoarcus taiwanensis]
MVDATPPQLRGHAMENPSRRLTARYILALVIIAMLVSGGHFVMVRALTEADSDSRIINLAGRQRMLSQRLVKTLGELTLVEPSRPAPVLRDSLMSDLDSWKRTHVGLQAGSTELGLPPASDPGIVAMLSALDDVVAALAGLIQKSGHEDALTDQALMREAHALSHDFVTRMDDIVFAWGALSEEKVVGLKRIAQAIWLLALLTLAAEAMLIFRPFVKQLSRSHHDLQSRARELERLAMVARRTTNAVVITDEKRSIQWVNEGFTRITGYAPEEVIGHSPAMFQAPETNPEAIALMRSRLSEGLGCRVEVLNRRKDGRQIWLDLDIQPLHDEAGCLTGFISIQSDITERRTLQYHANTDVLTGLPNRRRFFERLQAEHKRSDRNRSAGALLILDIDHFKRVNDVHGHVAGDKVLHTLANVIRRTIRQTDFPGRLGGEEFGVILPETDLSAASHLAERLRQQVEAQKTVVGGAELEVTISIGLAAMGPDRDIAEVFHLADQALYKAKGAGRNQVVVTEQ